MLVQIIIENGQKKVIPLTADTGTGAPVGTIIVVCSNQIPSNYLPLGTQYNTTLYPILYALLGTDTTPTASALGLPTLSSGQYAIKATSGLTENQQENVLNTINENNSYSTTEHATGKKWIDGKMIYRKVLPATLFTKDVQLNIQIGTNIDKGWVDFTHSYIYNTNGSFSGQKQPWNQTSMFVEGNNFFFTTGHSDFSNTTYIVAVVEYTKTV